MTHDQKLKEIRDACVKANPHRAELWEYDSGEPVGSGYLRNNPCRLADILATIGVSIRLEPDYNILRIGVANRGWESYDILHDDLTQQSDEFVDFIHSLLCV